MTPPPLLRLDGRRRASLARWLPEGAPLMYQVAVNPVSGVVTLTPEPPVEPPPDLTLALAQAFDALALARASDAITGIRAILALSAGRLSDPPGAPRSAQERPVDPEAPGEPRSGSSGESGGPLGVDWRDIAPEGGGL